MTRIDAKSSPPWRDGYARRGDLFLSFVRFREGTISHRDSRACPVASLWSRRLEGSRADVRRLVSADAPVVLIDDNCFGTDFLTRSHNHSFFGTRRSVLGA